jgi:hypothetical protein
MGSSNHRFVFCLTLAGCGGLQTVCGVQRAPSRHDGEQRPGRRAPSRSLQAPDHAHAP